MSEGIHPCVYSLKLKAQDNRLVKTEETQSVIQCYKLKCKCRHSVEVYGWNWNLAPSSSVSPLLENSAMTYEVITSSKQRRQNNMLSYLCFIFSTCLNNQLLLL